MNRVFVRVTWDNSPQPALHTQQMAAVSLMMTFNGK
jgi:hypothetical protein